MTNEERRTGNRERMRRWRAKNRERALAQGRESARRFRTAHPERHREFSRRWYSSHREQADATHRAWRAANKDKVAKAQRGYTLKWKAKDPGSIRERNRLNSRWRSAEIPEPSRRAHARWRAAHPEAARVRGDRRRTIKAGATGTHTVQEWLARVEETDGSCFYCGAVRQLTRDHVVPIVRGGTNSIDNIVPACAGCNASKKDLPLREWIDRRVMRGGRVTERAVILANRLAQAA